MTILLLFCSLLLAETPATFSVGAGGDVGFGRYNKSKQYRPHGGDDPFVGLAPLFHDTDLVFVNLETPLYDDIPKMIRNARGSSNGLIFRADTSYAHTLHDAGVDVVSLANNHLEDCGKEGAISTQRALEQANVSFVGTNVDTDPFQPVIINKEGTQIVVFARSSRRNYGGIDGPPHPYMAYEKTSSIGKISVALVKEYREKYPEALFIYSVHWGEEYSPNPYSSQRKVARALIDSGVDIFLGHHAHVLQPVEIYNDGVIIYSLGNMVFDQSSTRTRRSAYFNMEMVWEDKWKAKKIEITPLQLQKPPNTTLVSTNHAVLDEFYRNSRKSPYGTELKWENDVLIWERPTEQVE
jgi:poly-gamma-glutamate capsule biosynthesis protein CapA/YwtB (metallophosphatase superfamily)